MALATGFTAEKWLENSDSEVHGITRSIKTAANERTKHVELRDYIVTDAEILGGDPVFRGTRVPVASLFEHLESG